MNRNTKNHEPEFREMWERGEIDNLLKKSRKYLEQYPNNTNALYFRSKALISQRKNISEAKKYVERLIKNEPNLANELQLILEEIEKIESS